MEFQELQEDADKGTQVQRVPQGQDAHLKATALADPALGPIRVHPTPPKHPKGSCVPTEFLCPYHVTGARRRILHGRKYILEPDLSLQDTPLLL